MKFKSKEVSHRLNFDEHVMCDVTKVKLLEYCSRQFFSDISRRLDWTHECDKQRDGQTDRQTDRQTDKASYCKN